jgi:CHASE3 domain sensor protein
VISNLKDFFRRIFAPFQDRWKRVPLRWKGRVSIILPVTAILVSSTFAFFGNLSRQSIEASIERHFALVNSFNDVLTLMVNAETGMRGFQITKRDEFLQPYQLANTELPAKLNALQTLIESEPGENPRIEKTEVFRQISTLIGKQLSDLEWQKNHISKENGVNEELYTHLTLGKKYMDEIRSLLGNMESNESERLTERISEINGIRKRDYILVFITLSIAIITRFISWYLFKNGINRRISESIKKLKKLRGYNELSEETLSELDLLEDEIEYLVQNSNQTTKPV